MRYRRRNFPRKKTNQFSTVTPQTSAIWMCATYPTSRWRSLRPCRHRLRLLPRPLRFHPAKPNLRRSRRLPPRLPPVPPTSKSRLSLTAMAVPPPTPFKPQTSESRKLRRLTRLLQLPVRIQNLLLLQSFTSLPRRRT